jgi:hypothetical protein
MSSHPAGAVNQYIFSIHFGNAWDPYGDAVEVNLSDLLPSTFGSKGLKFPSDLVYHILDQCRDQYLSKMRSRMAEI